MQKLFCLFKLTPVFVLIFWWTGPKEEKIFLRLPLDPGLILQKSSTEEIIISKLGNFFRVSIIIPEGFEKPSFDILQALYSAQYGRIQNTFAIEFSWHFSEDYYGLIVNLRLKEGYELFSKLEKELW